MLWALPVTIMATISAISSFFGLTGGMGFVMLGFTLDQWQRHKGYATGDGVFSPKDGGAGTIIDMARSDHDLSEWLGFLALWFPEDFLPYQGKLFRFTRRTEGKLLRAMYKPIQELLNDSEVLIAMAAECDDPELQEAMTALKNRVRSMAQPILHYLSEFPKTRIENIAWHPELSSQQNS